MDPAVPVSEYVKSYDFVIRAPTCRATSATRGTDAHIHTTRTQQARTHTTRRGGQPSSQTYYLVREGSSNRWSDVPSYNEISHHVLVALQARGGGHNGRGSRWSAGSACYVGSAWDPLSVSIELCVHHMRSVSSGGRACGQFATFESGVTRHKGVRHSE